MAYNKHTWVDKELITPEKLNNIEDGIAEAGSGSSGVGQTVDYAEVKPTYDTTAFSMNGNEIFNDYRERTFSSSGSVSTGNVVAGAYSHAEGEATTASGDCSHSEGEATLASGSCSHAEGGSTIASGVWSHAEGLSTKATGNASHAQGQDTVASGNTSSAFGYGTTASGDLSCSFGAGTVASAEYQIVFGQYNVESTNLSDRFIVGNGNYVTNEETGNDDLVRSNCFRSTDTGVFASGAYNSSGADYAELFEWADGNHTSEDRRGLFVTLDGEHICIAKPGDKNIIGIVSGNPTVLGDVYDDQWQGMYMTDVFGSPIWEDVEAPDKTIERPDPEHPGKTIKEVVILAHTERRQKLNPNYDNTQKYKARTERPEWAPVGLIGKLVAIDDGTCAPGGYCTVGYDNGIATASSEETKYYVMSRIDDTHIRVFIKAR